MAHAEATGAAVGGAARAYAGIRRVDAATAAAASGRPKRRNVASENDGRRMRPCDVCYGVLYQDLAAHVASDEHKKNLRTRLLADGMDASSIDAIMN